MTTAETNRSGLSSSNASGSDTKEELKADAGRLKDTAKDRVRDEADKRKSQATRTARSASDALEKAASELERDDDAPSWLSSAFRETAKGIDSFAGKVEGRSPDQMGREVSQFARQHPGSFLAASALVGFAAARFLRAGADYQSHHSGGSSSDFGSQGFQSGQTGTFATTGSRFADEARTAQQRRDTTLGSMVR